MATPPFRPLASRPGACATRTRRWAPALLLVVLGTGVAVLTGCADHGSPARSDCILFANGNKLCGDDARSYCSGFIKDGDADGNVRACQAVGAPVRTAGEVN